MNKVLDKQMGDILEESPHEMGYGGRNEDIGYDSPYGDPTGRKKSLFLGGAVVLILIILALIFFRTGSRSNKEDIISIRAGLNRVGERLVHIEEIEKRIALLEEKEKGLLGIKWGKTFIIKVCTKSKQEQTSTDDDGVIKEAISSLNKLMEVSGFKGEIKADSTDEEIILDVKMDAELESLFIGKRGKNIDSYQYILNKIVENNLKDRVKRIVIDCAEYRVRRRESLKNMARNAAQELKNGSSLYIFPPMQAGDRRIIHMTMKEEGFNTESRGKGEEKKVVATTSQQI